MSKILVTGGAGFIGSNLVAHLLSQEHEVTVVDNLLTGNRVNILPFLERESFKFYEMGTETPAFKKALESVKFDEIYHLACPTGVPNIQNLGEEMVDACSTGTKQVLQLAQSSEASFLYTSSSEIYGNPAVFPQSESYTGNVHPQGWRANYEEGKRFSETLVSLFVKKYGVRARTVRLFNMYGPNMHLADHRVIPRFVTQALSGKELTVYGDGLQRRTLCFVSDLVDALGRVMSAGEAGGIYNIGGTEEVTIRQLAEMIIDYTASKSELVFLENVRAQHQDTDGRMPHLERISGLGWMQKVELDEGLEQTVKNFKIRIEATVPVAKPVEALYA